MTVSEIFKVLENCLSERSYVAGYQPSQADIHVINTLKTIPTSATPNVLRWYNHMLSYNPDEKKKFSFAQKPSSNEISQVISNIISGSLVEPKYAEPEDDDVDLFGSDEEEDAEAAKLKEDRVKAYAAKKEKKPALVAKSSIVLDVKPWDDETDMKKLESEVRTIQMDGLLWGASKLVAVGYGINKLQIMCIVEDDKVSVDDLCEKIQEFEDYVQSVDIAAFNKI